MYTKGQMETVITSASNDTVKHIKRISASAKAKREANTYIAEGIHLVRSFLAAGHTPLLYVHSVAAPGNPEIVELIKALKEADVKSAVITDSLFESVTSVHAGVGIAVLFSPPTPHKPSLPLTKNALLLEDIQDPGNMGTILRTAAAVGVGDVFLSAGCASPWSPKALRAGMGAQFALAIHEDSDLAQVIETAEIPVYATALTGKSMPLFDMNLNDSAAWLFGNEGQGVSEPLLQRGTTAVTIPQVEGPVESLNVAAAAAVCLYEQYRQSSL